MYTFVFNRQECSHRWFLFPLLYSANTQFRINYKQSFCDITLIYVITFFLCSMKCLWTYFILFVKCSHLFISVIMHFLRMKLWFVQITLLINWWLTNWISVYCWLLFPLQNCLYIACKSTDSLFFNLHKIIKFLTSLTIESYLMDF